MAIWKLTPSWKKSLAERNYFRKGDDVLMIETGWRTGEFTVTTEDDEPPCIEDGADLYSCGYEVEMESTFDGCWEEIDDSLCSEFTKGWLQGFFEEFSWLDLESEGWIQTDCEMIIQCDPVIELIEE